MNNTPDNSTTSVTARPASAELVDMLIEKGRESLDKDNLEGAIEFFKEALAVPGEYPDRASAIRLALKKYSDDLTEKKPPGWSEAESALGQLDKPGLRDEEVQRWRRDLKLKEASFHLKAKNLDASFDIFRSLVSEDKSSADEEYLKAEISRIVRRSLLEQAEQKEWHLIGRIIEGFEQLWPSADDLDEWLATISRTLEAVDQADREAKKKIDLVHAELVQAQNQLEQEQRRRRSITYILAIIAIITAIAYYLAIFVL